MSTGDSWSSGFSGGAIAGVSIVVGVILLVLAFMCSQGYRNGRANAAGDAAERAAAAAFAARPRALPPASAAQYWDNDEEEARRRRARTRRGSRTAGLPSFTYNLSVKHNVTDSGDDAAAPTCSVCLGEFQVGETVRLLPVCLHLYHVECIDPWLDAHATCPICRSGTDPAIDGSLLPPV